MPTAKESLFLTEDRKRVVKEGDKDAHFLLVAKGAVISDEDVKTHNVSASSIENQPQAQDDPHVVSYAPKSQAQNPLVADNKAVGMGEK